MIVQCFNVYLKHSDYAHKVLRWLADDQKMLKQGVLETFLDNAR